MAIPSCPKCGWTLFELSEIQVQKANWRHFAVICSSCGCVVSTEDVRNVTRMLDKIAEKMGVRFDW